MSLADSGNLGAITLRRSYEGWLAFRCSSFRLCCRRGSVAGVLESLEHAQARGANIIAEITGFGSTGDAHHMTAPEPSGEGAVRAMRQALAEGGFSLKEVGHLNAHGTATHVNDMVEAAAWHGLLDDDLASKVPVTSVKGTVGHMLGAAGAIEATDGHPVSRGIVPLRQVILSRSRMPSVRSVWRFAEPSSKVVF